MIKKTVSSLLPTVTALLAGCAVVSPAPGADDRAAADDIESRRLPSGFGNVEQPGDGSLADAGKQFGRRLPVWAAMWAYEFTQEATRPAYGSAYRCP